MSHENGTTDNRESKGELTEYIPYSIRHPENVPSTRFKHLFDYLERVIGVDMENATFHDAFKEDKDSKLVVLPNGKVLMANSTVASLSDTYDNEGPKGLFFAMPTEAFFGTYQTVFPYFKNEFLNNSLGVK